MNDLLFDPPFWLPMAIAAIAVVLLFQGNSRGQSKIKYAGLALSLVAVAYWGVSGYVQTDKEKVAANTRALVAAVDHRDWDAFGALLAPSAHFMPFYGNPAEFRSGLKESVDRYGVKDATAISVEMDDREPGKIVANLIATASVGATMDRPMQSSWQLDWVDDAGHWRLLELRLIPGGSVPSDVIERSLRRAGK